jgi:polar amino acid transport system substrate-binding protein
MGCIGAIVSVVTGLVLAGSDPIVIGTEAPFPAYIYVADDGTLSGHDYDLMDQICTRAALNCSWELANFDELIPGVMDGRFDVIIGGIAVTPERRTLVDFTQPYYSSDPEEWYLGRSGAPEPANALIAVQSGTVHEAHLRKLGYRHIAFSTEPQVLAAIAEGSVDLALGPFETRGEVQDFADANGLEYLYYELIPDDGVAMAVCRGNSDLLDSLNLALDAMRADGTLEILEDRWF